MSLRKEIILLPLVIMACRASEPKIEDTNFPQLVRLSDDFCEPNSVIFSPESGHLYEFSVDFNGEKIKQDFIINKKGQNVEFKKPDSDQIEKIQVGQNFGLQASSGSEPRPIAKLVQLTGDIIVFQGCESLDQP